MTYYVNVLAKIRTQISRVTAHLSIYLMLYQKAQQIIPFQLFIVCRSGHYILCMVVVFQLCMF